MEIKAWLIQNSEETYREFSSSLASSKYQFLGVRIPKLRAQAKSLVKDNDLDALQLLSDETFEEVMMQGFVVAYSDQLIEIKETFILDYLIKCDNWSLVDSFVSSFKFDDYEKQAFFEILNKWTNDDLVKAYPYIQRFILVSYLKYLDEQHIDTVITYCSTINNRPYCVEMALAWLLATASINYHDKVKTILNKLDDNTLRYYKSKIRDSYRISKDIKKEVSEYGTNR